MKEKFYIKCWEEDCIIAVALSRLGAEQAKKKHQYKTGHKVKWSKKK